jgi:hypothetical protein
MSFVCVWKWNEQPKSAKQPLSYEDEKGRGVGWNKQFSNILLKDVASLNI